MMCTGWDFWFGGRRECGCDFWDLMDYQPTASSNEKKPKYELVGLVQKELT